jgi:urease gamma subunit
MKGCTTMKRLPIIITIVLISLMGVGFASAQDPAVPADQEQRAPRFDRPDGTLVDLVAEATGLERQEIVDQLREGATLAEIITANGGDLEALQAAMVEALVTNRGLDETAAQERVTQFLNGELRPGDGNGNGFGPREDSIVATVAEATGLEAREIVEQLREGVTLAEVIEASGADVEAVQAELVNILVTNRALDEAAAQERVNQALNGQFQPGNGPRGNGQQGNFGPGNGQQGGFGPNNGQGQPGGFGPGNNQQGGFGPNNGQQGNNAPAQPPAQNG